MPIASLRRRGVRYGHLHLLPENGSSVVPSHGHGENAEPEDCRHSPRCELCVCFAYAGRARGTSWPCLWNAVVPFYPSPSLRAHQRILLSSACALAVVSQAWAGPAATEAAGTIALSEISVVAEAPAATFTATPNASAAYVGGVTGIGGGLRPVYAASAGIITGAQINSRPVTRPGEVLEEVPGLIITQHSGEGKANQYFLRGFNLDHGTDIAIHVDGKPVNMRTHAHGQGYADLNFLIPELVGAVEFHKGPYFVRDGDFASAGSVRIDYLDKLNRNIALTTFGSFGLKRALSAASVPLGEGNLLVAGEAQTYDGPWVVPDACASLTGSCAIARERLSMASRHRHGLLGQVERDQPDRGTSGQRGDHRPLRHPGPDRWR